MAHIREEGGGQCFFFVLVRVSGCGLYMYMYDGVDKLSRELIDD